MPLTPQHSNVVLSSFVLFVDNTVLSKGNGYTNTNSYFYPVAKTYKNLFSYAAPYKSFVSDFSIGGATIPTGVYLDSSFLITGTSGFSGINYNEGVVYFGSEVTGQNRISGSYAVKEFDVFITSQPEEALLFETQYQIKNKVGKTITGISPNSISCPVIFLKNQGGNNEEWALGGTENTKNEIIGIIIADSQYNLDAVTSILKDTVRKTFPLLSGYEMPFNLFGSFRSGILFNYNNFNTRADVGNSAYISNVEITTFGMRSPILTEFKKINKDMYPAISSFTIETIRNPRG